LYDEPLKLSALRDDLVFYAVPFDKIVAQVCHDAKLRRLVKNMIYDGVLSRLLNIDLSEMEHALRRQLGKKTKAIELNLDRFGFLTKLPPQRVLHLAEIDVEQTRQDAVVDHVLDQPAKLRVVAHLGNDLVERNGVKHEIVAQRAELQGLVVQ